MSGGFELQPQDGGPRVALAPGETVIGRGPLLGITDKRVSRRHAILEVVGGQLRIKPIHTNPCFYHSSEKSQPLPMKINLWRWLNPGDSFSLLVDKYIFHVFATHSETEMECTLRNSQMLDEDNILNEAPKSPVTYLPDKTTGTSQLERSTELAKIQTTTTNSVSFLGECRDFSKQQSNPAQRKRVLPAWMLAENLSDQNLSALVIGGDNNIIQGYGKEGICKDKPQVNMTQQGRKRLISSGNSESILAEEDAGKKCKNADQEESVISSKNPVHFQHFSHPGDSDYGGVQVTDQDETDDRPECPYGASCYRKNPQHKIEYRHSTCTDEDNDDVGQPNESDLNDSFLDDEEEEYEPTDEDSDWEPGKEDQEKEDVEELLKEAKKFMKRKK
ncbi:aprataxin and PNK-like factor isoform X3 [Sciurus carolinensis]|uniref:aprataxin and PNK-like factor isoform X3 n=1 Tax=Sciurus carolinensis TaxID=30640 RepID=UPI001FB2735D|nr:aprataxin and PNK-like factor isoform X3 [Sciurus carolinensis]